MKISIVNDKDFVNETGTLTVYHSRDILKSGYPVKAIYAMNDLMALGAIRQIRDCGLQVPDDIGVIGFDDSEYGWFSNPSLTTVHVPLDEIGRESAAALITKIEHGVLEKKRILLECTLVERESYRRKQ